MNEQEQIDAFRKLVEGSQPGMKALNINWARLYAFFKAVAPFLPLLFGENPPMTATKN